MIKTNSYTAKPDFIRILLKITPLLRIQFGEGSVQISYLRVAVKHLFTGIDHPFLGVNGEHHCVFWILRTGFDIRLPACLGEKTVKMFFRKIARQFFQFFSETVNPVLVVSRILRKLVCRSWYK